MDHRTNGILVRAATPDDIPAIRHIHRDCDDPWGNEEECRAWVEKRLERGFAVEVAEWDGRVAGHAEWVVSDEPDRKFLYLGMLQVDGEYQKQGIGRAMVESGILLARREGCSSLVTIPDEETGSERFYGKCGFTRRRRLYRCVLPATLQGEDAPAGETDGVPFGATHALPFVFGLAQASSRHMWEVCNRRPATDDRLAPSARLADGSYMQLSYFQGNDTALALCWSASHDRRFLVRNILSFGRRHGLSSIAFVFGEEESESFRGMNAQHENTEICRHI